MSRERASEQDRSRRIGLRRQDLDPDPIAQFREWFQDAGMAGPMPERMTLATVDDAGHPDARMVLLKGVDRRGFRFFTNLESNKAMQLRANPFASLVFHWPELDRQVRVRGTVTRIAEDEALAYFSSRDRLSRLGAWASPQSRPLDSRKALEDSLSRVAERFGGVEGGNEVPKPDHWGGFLIEPRRIEFWQGRAGRLHDRFVYERSESDEAHTDSAKGWSIVRLAP